MANEVEVTVQDENSSWDKIEERFFESYKASVALFEQGLAISPDRFTAEDVADLKAEITKCGAFLTTGLRGLLTLMQTSREIAKFTSMTPPVVVGETA